MFRFVQSKKKNGRKKSEAMKKWIGREKRSFFTR